MKPGPAKVSVDFDRWPNSFITPSSCTVEILPSVPLAPRRPVSPRVGEKLVHSDRNDQIQKVQFFDKDSKIIASNFPKNNLQVWDAKSKSQLVKLATPEELKYSDQFWAIYRNQQLISFLQGRAKVKSVEQGSRLGVQVAYPNSAMQVWSTRTGELLDTFHAQPRNQIRDFKMSTDQKYLTTDEMASGTFFDTQPNIYRMYELASGQWRNFPVGVDGPVIISRDSQFCFAFLQSNQGNFPTEIGIFEMPELKLTRRLELPAENARGSQLVLSRDERFLICEIHEYQDNRNLREWQSHIVCYDIATGQTVGNVRIETPNPSINFVNRQLADGTLVYWNWVGETKKLTALDVPSLAKKWETALGNYDLIKSVTVEPSGKWLAAICYPDVSRFGVRQSVVDWELVVQSEMFIVGKNGNILEEMTLPVGASAMDFSQDGKKAALGGVGGVYLIDFSAPFARRTESD